MRTVELTVVEISELHKRRFWNCVDKNGSFPDPTNPNYQGLNQCWHWTAYRDKDGYGTMRVGRLKRRAHRIAFAIGNNKHLSEEWILHRCDNPQCVNPDHLQVGTSQSNHFDMQQKKRIAKGEKSGMSKLHSSDIPKIKKLRRDGFTWPAIGLAFNVSGTAVRLACLGQTWKHVECD